MCIIPDIIHEFIQPANEVDIPSNNCCLAPQTDGLTLSVYCCHGNCCLQGLLEKSSFNWDFIELHTPKNVCSTFFITCSVHNMYIHIFLYNFITSGTIT